MIDNGTIDIATREKLKAWSLGNSLDQNKNKTTTKCFSRPQEHL